MNQVEDERRNLIVMLVSALVSADENVFQLPLHTVQDSSMALKRPFPELAFQF